jgi:hypothetical protein
MARGRNPVEWLLGNRELLVVLFAAAVWLLNRIGAAHKKNAARPGPVQPADGEAERTRRVQEEVRRRIAERRAPAQSGAAPAAPVEPDSFEPPRIGEEAAPPDAVAAPEDAEEAILARQRSLESQLMALEAGKAAALAQARAAAAAPRPGSRGPAGSPAAAHALLADLQDPSAVRRAVVLREILGAPVGLRRRAPESL